MRRALLLLTLVLVLAACGGTSGLTKEQYAAKVNNLCLVAADRFREMHLSNSIAAWRHYATTIVATDRDFETGLAALKPPSAVALQAATFRTRNEFVVRSDQAAVAAAKAGDRQAFRRALAFRNANAGYTSLLAKKIGATGCYIR